MKTWLVLFISLSFVYNLDAQSLSHQVSSDSILLGNYFIYEIQLNNVNADIDYPNLDEFEIVSGPNTTTSMSMVNGDMSSSKSMRWYLRPVDLGQYFVLPISVAHDGTSYEADALEINVYANPNGTIEKPKQNSMDDFFNLKRTPLMNREDPPSKTDEEKKPKRVLKKG